MALKLKPKLDLKFILKKNKRIKIITGGNGINTSKCYVCCFFLRKNNQEISMNCDDKHRYILLSKLAFLKIFDCMIPYTVSYISLFVIVICINYYLKHKVITIGVITICCGTQNTQLVNTWLKHTAIYTFI